MPRMMPGRPPPVDELYVVTPYPEVAVTRSETTLAALAGGRPTVVHLYTG